MKTVKSNIAVAELKNRVEIAAAGWTGLDCWRSDDGRLMSRDEHQAVLDDALRAEQLGRSALDQAAVGDWAGCLELLEDAAEIEQEYGDCICWGSVLRLAKKLAAVLTRDHDEIEIEDLIASEYE